MKAAINFKWEKAVCVGSSALVYARLMKLANLDELQRSDVSFTLIT